MPRTIQRHALFATVEPDDSFEPTLTFRVGQPVYSYERALARFSRLWADGAVDVRQRSPLAQARIRHNRRWYRVRFMEVRAVDRHGRGLGRPDHGAAIPVPYRAAQRVS